jgi:hypothetical protein
MFLTFLADLAGVPRTWGADGCGSWQPAWSSWALVRTELPFHAHACIGFADPHLAAVAEVDRFEL